MKFATRVSLVLTRFVIVVFVYCTFYFLFTSIFFFSQSLFLLLVLGVVESKTEGNIRSGLFPGFWN